MRNASSLFLHFCSLLRLNLSFVSYFAPFGPQFPGSLGRQQQRVSACFLLLILLFFDQRLVCQRRRVRDLPLFSIQIDLYVPNARFVLSSFSLLSLFFITDWTAFFFHFRADDLSSQFPIPACLVCILIGYRLIYEFPIRMGLSFCTTEIPSKYPWS